MTYLVTLKYAHCPLPDRFHIMCVVLQEFRQRSLEWEQQRLLYERQVTSLEAQRKTLAEQFTQIQVML